MPGKPTRATPQTTLYRDGATGRTLPVTSHPGAQRRSTDATIEQIDRRIGGRTTEELLAHVGPDNPGRRTGRLWLRPHTASSDDAGGGGPPGTVLGSTTLVAPDGTADPSHPTTTVLPDDTILLAWVDLTTHVLHLRHHSRDLTTLLGSTTTPATNGGTYGCALAQAGGTILLATGSGTGGTIHTVTTSPLTIGPGAPYSGDITWDRTRAAAIQTADQALVGAGAYLVALRPDRTATILHTADDDILGIHPADNHRQAHVSVLRDFEATDVLTIDTTTGALTSTVTGPTLDSTWPGTATPLTGGRWAFPAMDRIGTADHLLVHDATGATLTDPAWPAEPRWIAGHPSMIPTPAGGTVLAIPHRAAGEGFQPGRVTLASIDTRGQATVTEIMADTPGFDTTTYTTSGATATNGRVGAFVSTFIADPTGSQAVTTRAWTMALAAPQGILAIDTLDHEWWLVGTRDPAMAYRLHVDTPLGWVVEIVSGEEPLATWELVVDPGPTQDWARCALMRPDA